MITKQELAYLIRNARSMQLNPMIYCIIITIMMMLTSCMPDADRKEDISKYDSTFFSSSFRLPPNLTDEKGLRQGVWYTYNEKGDITAMEVYADDMLTGLAKYYFEPAPGKRECYYYFYEGNVPIWSFCAYYFNRTRPLYTETYAFKGLSIHKDSAYVKIPYDNDRVRIEGCYINKFGNYAIPTGLHKSYYPNGRLKTVENWFVRKTRIFNGKVHGTPYLNGKYILYDSTGKVILDTVFNMHGIAL